MANTTKSMSFGPVALTTTLTTNVLNLAVTSMAGPVGITLAQPYGILKRVRIVNKTASAATFSLWLGGTGGNVAGTEFLGIGAAVPANSYVEFFPTRRMDSTQFLVGGSGTATALTIEGDIDVGLS